MAVLRNLKADEAEELRRLRAENEALKASQSAMTFKIGPSGGLSVYMGGRYPTTLYADQWERLLSNQEAILTFIRENRAKLKARD